MEIAIKNNWYSLTTFLLCILLDLNENRAFKPWNLVLQETEAEFNLIRSEMGFFPAHYHGGYFHFGRSNIEPSAGPFGYSSYIATNSTGITEIFVDLSVFTFSVLFNYTSTLLCRCM